MDFGVSINPMKLCAKFMFVYLFLRNWAVMSYPRGPWPKRGNVHWSGMWLGTSVGDAMGLGSGPASLSGPPPCPACATNSGEYPSLMTLCLSFLFQKKLVLYLEPLIFHFSGWQWTKSISGTDRTV